MDPALIERVAQLAREERGALPKLDIERLRHDFLRHARRRAQRRIVLWLAPVAALVMGLFVVVWRSDPADLAFEVDGERGRVGELLVAPEARELRLDFSDTSVVSLARTSAASVVSLDRQGAELKLERGHAEVRVQHAPATRWQVQTGPFRTEVVGTRFAIEWDPTGGRFALELFEGSVRVNGPGLRKDCLVSRGDRLQASLTAGSIEGACGVGERESEAEAEAAPAASVPPAPIDTTAAHEPVRVQWQALGAAGRHREAWDEVTAQGLENVRARAGAGDLMLLADLARFNGRADTAVSVLLTLRSRFGASSEARQAAFLIGRIAADQQGAPGTAARWFATYLSESPGGAFAAEALGRLLESRHQAGDEAGARESARAYRERYPTGPYAALAERVLASGPQEAP